MKNQIYLVFSEYLLRPELFLASRLHLALTLWTGMFIPQSDVITAALQTQTANLTSIGRCHVGNDATYHDVLDGLAVRTRHGRNLLTEEPASLVHLSLVSALSAAVFQFPRHQSNEHNLFQSYFIISYRTELLLLLAVHKTVPI